MDSANELQKSGLTEVQLKAASLLAMGLTTVGAAHECGTSRSTLHLWRKNPAFAAQLDTLLAEAKDAVQETISNDIVQIKDVVLGVLLDVAKNDRSGSARVAAARTLGEYVERHEERAKHADDDLMADKSGEIKAILEHIRNEKTGTADSGPDNIGSSL